MSAEASAATSNDGTSMSLSEQLRKAQSLISEEPSTDPVANKTQEGKKNATTTTTTSTYEPLLEAIAILERLQEQIQRGSIFSNNEALSDIQTSSIPLISVEYHMAKACLQLRTISSTSRNTNVKRAMELFHLFLHRSDSFEGILEGTVQHQYQHFLAQTESAEEEDATSPAGGNKMPIPISSSRDEKIARFRRSKEIKQQSARMSAQLAQRKRLHLEDHEDLDGHDEDSLLRSLYTHQLNEFAFDAIEELYSSHLEVQMLQMAVRMEKDREEMGRHRYGDNTGRDQHGGGNHRPGRGMTAGRPHPPLNDPNLKMKMTQVLQDPNTGQLIFKKQEVQSTMFRPSWNQPTMSLEELAEKEVKEAMDREARQKISEIQSKNAPRRYEFLVKDGMEDDANLVDASAKLDREWDNWKDENPRGSGNKMGDVGDRNF